MKIDNDCYDLGTQRTAVKGSQLEEANELTHEFVRTGVFKVSTIAELCGQPNYAEIEEIFEELKNEYSQEETAPIVY